MLDKKAEARQAQMQGQGELSSKRQRGDGGGAVLNCGIGRRTSKQGTMKGDLDDGHGDVGDGVLGDSVMMFYGDDEPGWFQIHRVINTTLGVPGEWVPVSDVEPPAEYIGDAFYASLRWRDRNILNMLDKVSPLSNHLTEMGVDLCPQLLVVVSDIVVYW